MYFSNVFKFKMKPRVNVYSDKNYKGTVKVLQDEGIH